MNKRDENLMLNAFKDASSVKDSMEDIDLILEDIKEIKRQTEHTSQQNHTKEIERGAYTDMWIRGFSAKGITSRSEFWGAYVTHIVIVILLYFVDVSTRATFLATIYLVISLLPILAMTMRRLEDTRHSALWALLIIVPPLGIIPLIFCALPSKSTGQTTHHTPKNTLKDDASQLVYKIKALSNYEFNQLCFISISASGHLLDRSGITEKQRALGIIGATTMTFLTRNFPDRTEQYDQEVEMRGAGSLHRDFLNMDKNVKQELDRLIKDILGSSEGEKIAQMYDY